MWRCRLQKLEDNKAFLIPPGWNEYIPKKIDTQKVYRYHAPSSDIVVVCKSKPEAMGDGEEMRGGWVA